MAGERILVAEDDPLTLRFVTSLLREKGYEVLEAQDGERLHELALNAAPDLILTDLVMPYRDGFEVLRDLRARPELDRVPILVMSMKDREEDIVYGLEHGADDYVVKPFNARELLARVRKQLEARSR